MRELAKKRLSANLKQSVRYLTLVFNDFFILALIFLFGALMYWYAESMKTMPNNLWFYHPLVGLFIWLPLLTGRLVTLIREADQQFLFTQDEEMGKYLSPMFRYSLILPFILEILLAGIIFPFATIKAGFTTAEYLLLIITALLLKVDQLEADVRNLYFGKRISFLVTSLLALVILLISSSFSTMLGLAATVLISIMFSVNFQPMFGKKMNVKKAFNWRYAVANEKARKDRIYSLFSMFTDVSEKQVSIRRRKYLDFLLPDSFKNSNPNLFLYRRSLLRNPEYLNLFVRMTVFAMLISWLVQDPWWALVMSGLVMFLTLYQLMPMATEFDSNIMYRVYPIVKDNRAYDLAKVLRLGIYIQWLLIGTVWLIVLPLNKTLFIAFIALIAVTLIIIYAYLPHKIKSISRNIR